MINLVYDAFVFLGILVFISALIAVCAEYPTTGDEDDELEAFNNFTFRD